MIMDAGAYFDERFRAAPVMIILRGESPDRTVELATRAWDAGIATIEIPLQSRDAERALERTIAALGSRGAAIGAGTITTPELADRAHAVGAEFTVAPGLDFQTVERSHALGMPHLPGVATGTEIQHASNLGLRWMKAFPASLLGTEWIGAMAGPFPEVRLVATGGIHGGNAEPFLAAGAGAVSLGASFDSIERDALDALAHRRS